MAENNNFIERQQEGIGAGAWSLIEKTEWQPAQKDSWVLPVIQQAFVSGSKGMLGVIGGMAVGTVSACYGGPFLPVLGLGVAGGLLYALYDFSRCIDSRFETQRIQELKREVYQREQKAALAQSHEWATIEAINRQTHQITYDQFPAQTGDLVLIYDAVSTGEGKLSKNSIAKVLGCSTEKAAEILTSLENQHYIQYLGSRNAPQGAIFTAKGETNCRALWEKSQKMLVDTQK